MLDNLYENIGDKIKNWAKWIFIVEAIGAIVTGLILLFTDDDLIGYGLLTLICGPIVAWVSSWILYAFGQLVEDVHAIRDKEGISDETNMKRETEENKSQTKTDEPKINLRKSTQCECGELYYGLYCPVCGKSSKTQKDTSSEFLAHNKTEPDETAKKSHICKCGERFYGETCPNCGRNLKGL